MPQGGHVCKSEAADSHSCNSEDQFARMSAQEVCKSKPGHGGGHICKNELSGARSCKREGEGCCVCKNEHLGTCSCKSEGGRGCICKLCLFLQTGGWKEVAIARMSPQD